jgi:phosphoribosyl 1,2-cyclic phosphodiesterase
MEIIVLASGSKGNATYIETDYTKVIIDAGISYKQMKERLASFKKDIQLVDAILLTHEHSDHTKGLPTLIKHTSAPLYTVEETFNHLYEKTTYELPYTCFKKIEPSSKFYLNDLTIEVIPVSHDAVSTVGFKLTDSLHSLVYMTDVGYLPKEDYPKLKNADAYIFESNYDVSLLFSSARPYYLKKRIDSVKGHLSNADSSYHLSQLIGDKTKVIVLAHPSLECNTERHAYDTLIEVLKAYEFNLDRFKIEIAKQFEPLNPIIL